MIHIVQRGLYSLVKTRSRKMILILDKKNIFKLSRQNIQLLSQVNDIACKVCMCAYRLYDVKDEGMLTDQMHLELCIGKGHWQGYLLPEGLPTKHTSKKPIVPTQELIGVSNEELVPAVNPYCEC